MSENTQNSIWNVLFIATLMVLGALIWGILKTVKRAVQAFTNDIRVKRQTRASTK